MVDRALFIIQPDVTDATILAFLSAIQAYELNVITKTRAWNQAHQQTKEVELELDLVCPKTYHFIFERCLSTLKNIGTERHTLPFVKYDYACSFSLANALSLGEVINRPLAQSLGVICGSDATTLPDVSNLITEYPQVKKNVLCQSDYYSELMAQNTHQADMISLYNPLFAKEQHSLESRARLVFMAAAVIGDAGFETYLACALLKPVLELKAIPRVMKWRNKQYSVLTEFNQESLVKGIKICLLQLSNASTQMDQEMLVAQSAITSLE